MKEKNRKSVCLQACLETIYFLTLDSKIKITLDYKLLTSLIISVITSSDHSRLELLHALYEK